MERNSITKLVLLCVGSVFVVALGACGADVDDDGLASVNCSPDVSDCLNQDGFSAPPQVPAGAQGPVAGSPAPDSVGSAVPMPGEAGVPPSEGTAETPPAEDPMAAAPMDAAMDPTAPNEDGVPAGDHCAAVGTWDPGWVAFEDEVLRLTNEWRAKGANCDTNGAFGPAPPVSMNAMLRCSARLHSKDMGEANFFAHSNLAGQDPFVRMKEAGYQGSQMGENIAKGQQTAAEVVNGWIDSDGHCSNMMNPGFTELGVGYWEGVSTNAWFNGQKLWTQNFGAPGGAGGGITCPPGWEFLCGG